ncbi:molybdopterin molybdotransferase MoeA [Crassaminicella thermophila]|uniref:Molybdopterin molybdenumtransferase n=1 Tax=Crassaminicella thermophila TaxID=2599308 RepID=A0A5C0SE22_CRATE|nr:gephyrin-like molybdotransferase Glp [Crassaminicella thermophila]QEK11568.1 molybdopterin molybdotransferase MoeA [Crassaminicella thermophila]
MKLLNVDTVEEVKQKIDHYFEHFHIGTEVINITEALDRILSEDVYASIDLPEFNRSTVDGYAVVSKDTFGVNESLPTFLEVVGKVEMGENTTLSIISGQAAYVPTGGMIPIGADGVVMIEYVENLDNKTIAVYHPVAPGDGIIKKGEDIKNNSLLLSKGRKLKSQDIGALAAVGVDKVKVFKKIKTAIISTGDEIVDITCKVKLGQIRDINTYSLSAMVIKMGGEVTKKIVVEDNYETLRDIVKMAIKENDFVVISGGSSVGEKDLTEKVIDSFGDVGVFVNGVSIKPGKPTIIGKVENTAIFGLPGHPVSAIVVFRLFGGYLRDKVFSINEKKIGIYAICDANIHSSEGKETYQMVRIEEKDNEYIAKPIHGKSGAISLMTKAEGYIKIDTNKEGVKKGEKVKVILL